MSTSFAPTKTSTPAAQERHRKTWQSLAVFTFIFAAACVIFFADLGKYPLFNPDEGLYAEPAREMLETGEYITTLLNYVVRYTKPPLAIWGMAGCFQIFGVNEFAGRFFGAVCGALAVAVAYLITERYVSTRAAALTAAMVMTAPLFIGTARMAITDMPLTLFVSAALFAFFHGFTQKQGIWRWVGYALVGLAVMTKGPVGLLLPAMILVGYHFLRGDIVEAWRYYRPLAGALIVAAIAVPWFAVEIYITKGAYYYEFLVRENFQRFTGVVDHKYPWWYHLAAVGGGFLPWSIFIPQAFWSLGRSLSFDFHRKALIYGCLQNLDQRRQFALFCSLTVILTVGFFSASVSKLMPYTVPAFPALAAVLALYLDKEISQRDSRHFAMPFLVLTIVSGVGLAVVPVAVTRLRDAPVELISVIYSGVLALLVISAATTISAFRKKRAAAITFFAISIYAVFLSFGSRALDVLANEWEVPVMRFAQYAAWSEWPVFVFNMRKPAVPFYLHRPVRLPHDEAELIRGLGETNGAYVIAKTKDRTFLESLPNCRIVAQQGKFVLVAQRPRTATNH